MSWRERIATDPEVYLGLPCIKGTDILVWQVVDQVAGGQPVREILKKNPNLKPADVRAAVHFARDWAKQNVPPADPKPFFL